MTMQQGSWDPSVLAGTVAVVTGACNHGIGWGLAKHCAAVLGMHIALVDLHQNIVDAAVVELAAACPAVHVIGVQCDVAKQEEVTACAAAVKQRYFPAFRIGAVFANAGVQFSDTVQRSRSSDWALTFSVNVLGVVHTVQAFLPLLQSSREPSIIATTASVGGALRGDGASASYMASKHAVVCLTESLSFELARKYPQIRVHTLLPCQVLTGFGHTSSVNRPSAEGAASVAPGWGGASEAMKKQMWWMMSPEAHARQVFDRISRAEFYVLGENVRPYVDHDFPFGALELMHKRGEDMQRLQLDNHLALAPDDGRGAALGAGRTTVLRGPMFEEEARRRTAAKGWRARL